MSATPKDNLTRINTVTTAWTTLRPDKAFGGMTLEQFKAKVKPSLDARAEMAALDKKLLAAQDQRDAADKVSMAAINLMVNAVKGDPAEGDDGEFYEALDYVRKSDRNSGLHRGKGKAAQDKPKTDG